MRYDNGLCISLYLTRIQRWGNIKKCIWLEFFQLFCRSCSLNIIARKFRAQHVRTILIQTPPNLFGDIYAIFNWILMQRYIERYILSMYILMIVFIGNSMICIANQKPINSAGLALAANRNTLINNYRSVCDSNYAIYYLLTSF